jgi:hypothetical protein
MLRLQPVSAIAIPITVSLPSAQPTFKPIKKQSPPFLFRPVFLDDKADELRVFNNF